MKKIWKIMLSLVLLMSSLTFIPKTQVIAEIEADHQKISDEGTVDSWKTLFTDKSTEHAGGIWTDKSVFSSVNDYVSKTSEVETADSISKLAIDEDNFLVSLSAIASTKSVVGYSNVPTDTILVLDMSTSMINNRSVDELAYAANKAMQELLALNNHNRVGVVVYAGNTTGRFDREAIGATEVLLPLDRYTATKDVYGPNNNTDGVNDFLHFKKDRNSEWNNIYVVEGVKNSNNENAQRKEKTTSSGTFIQDGVYVALQEFLNVPKEDVTIKPGQIQSGTDRLPIMVIMTDGEPTLAVTDFDGNNGSLGKNEMNYQDHGYDDITFLSQLTASYAKYAIDQHYNESPLFYTLGLNVDEDVALVMNPDPEYPGANQNLISRFNRYWNDLTTTGRTRLVDSNIQLSYDAAFMKDKLQAYRSYSDGYYRAGNEQGLLTAFDNIVKEIILQSLYYPTLIENNLVHADGYLTFIDYIGHYMEIKNVKGLQFGKDVYTGEKFSRFIVTGSAGTQQNPTELGDNVVWALTERLGLERNATNINAVRQLILSAYQTGQISYNASTGAFSNYVGWFGNDKGQYLGFWDGTEAGFADAPANAVSANKSYLFLDGLGEGHRETDVLYASVQVSEAIVDYTSGRGVLVSKGETMMYSRFPASLIPLIEYNVTLKSDKPEEIKNFEVSGTKYPTRLLYEVGLSDDVDVLNLSETATTAKETRNSDPNKGKYVFYTNQYSIWSSDQTATGEPWLHNAYAMYEPSEENEHYFYNENTPVYTDRAGTRATSIVSGTEYYHRYLIYKYDGTTYSSVYEYVPISPEVLADSKNYASDSTGVYVKKGVIHRYFTDHIVSKGTNPTNTVAYSSYPYVHLTPDSYHVDDVLGNNGKLIVEPYEGIKLTKRIDSSLNADNTLYEFTITINNNAGSETFVMVNEDVNGNRVYGTVEFVNGSAVVSLKANETLYVLGNSSHALSGMDVTVTETEKDNYEVSKIVVNNQEIALPGNSTQFTVADDAITAVEFTNKKVVTGDVIIEKTVISDHQTHKTDKEFSFEIMLTPPTGSLLENEYPATLVHTNSVSIQHDSGKIVDEVSNEGKDGKYVFLPNSSGATAEKVKLSHGDYIHISGLAKDVKVTVNETDKPDYFELSYLNGNSAIVKVGEVNEIHAVNTYKPMPNDPVTFTLTGTKKLNDTSFTSAVDFNFKLEKLNPETKVYEIVKDSLGNEKKYTVSYGPGDTEPSKQFTDSLTFEYDKAGTYSYRITEIPSELYPGIVYDPVQCFFTVEVTDDGTGKLVVNVVAGSDTTITGNTILVEFNNQYIVNGFAEVILEMTKEIDNGHTGTTIPLSYFQFEVYQADNNYVIDSSKTPVTVMTNASGKAAFNVVFTQGEFDKDFYYVIKEKANSITTSYPGTIGYDTTEYRMHVKTGTKIVNSEVIPTIDVKIYTGDINNPTLVYPDSTNLISESGREVVLEIKEKVKFKNTYSPTPVGLTIPVTGFKHFDGYPDGLQVPQFTFKITKLDGTGTLTNESLTQTVAGSDGFAFVNADFFKYEKAGTYQYVVEEVIPSNASMNKLNGITYDETKYLVTVKVTGDDHGALHASIDSIENMSSLGTQTVIEFHNTYSSEDVDVVLNGHKTLVSDLWTLNPNTFSFNLYETEDTFDTTGKTPIQTVTNGLGNDAGAFQFALNYEKAGKYYYVIEEVVPSGVDSNNKLNGITFDTTKYHVTVEVKDQGTGELSTTVTGLDSNNLASFTNKYDVQSIDSTIKGSKHIDGALLDAKYQGTEFYKFFEFELYNAEVVQGEWTSQGSLVKTTKIKEVKADGTGYFEFTENYTKPGDYYYVVTEKFMNDDPFIVYDPTTYHIRVNVVDNLDGKLKSSVSYAMIGNSSSYDEVVFRNIVHPEEIVLTDIGGTKQLTGWGFDPSIEKPEFTFELYQSNAEGQRVDANTGTTEVEPLLSTTVQGSGNFVFADVEDNPLTTGVDEATHYLKFSGPGTYYYLIAEKIPADAVNNIKNSVTYDPSEYLVKIVVTMNEAENNSTHRDYFTYTVSYSSKGNAVDKDDVKFKNEFDANEAEVVFKGKKTLIGREIQDSEFVFGLYPADASGNITGNTPAFTGSNVGSEFEIKAVFDEPGVFYYVLKEQKGNNPTITYDDGKVPVRVTVNYNDQTGSLEADTDVFVDNRWEALEYFNSDFQFVNTYTPTTVSINIQKTLEVIGTGTHGLAGFEFMLEEKNGHSGVLAPSDAAGKAGFILMFDETHLGPNMSEKKYEFVLSETNQNETGMTYDKKKVEISLVVKVSSEGKLIVTAEGSDVPLSEVSATFTNTYSGTEDVPEKPVDPTPTPVVPNTGDDSNMMGYGLLMGVAALLMVLLFVMKKTRKSEK